MRVGLVTGIASAVYLVTLLAVPLLDRETDVLRAYPEDYTTGLAGALVRIGYVAVALMALAIAASVVRERSWLERIAAVLLVAGGAASVVLAWAPQRVAGGMLLIGVLALAVAPILVSIGGRRRLSPIIVTLGIFVTAGFVALIVLAPRELAGIANRSWDVLLAIWGLSFAWYSRGASLSQPGRAAVGTPSVVTSGPGR